VGDKLSQALKSEGARVNTYVTLLNRAPLKKLMFLCLLQILNVYFNVNRMVTVYLSLVIRTLPDSFYCYLPTYFEISHIL
jgi:hypothetical protein